MPLVNVIAAIVVLLIIGIESTHKEHLVTNAKLPTREEYSNELKLMPVYMQLGKDVNFGITPEDILDQTLDLLRVGPNSIVCDVGCGDGRTLIKAAQRGAIGWGVESSELRYKFARELVVKFGLEDKITIVHGDYRDTVMPREFSHLITFLWPQVTERVIAYSRQFSNSFKVASVSHQLEFADCVSKHVFHSTAFDTFGNPQGKATPWNVYTCQIS